MKALSLTQPWATLIAVHAKKIETRSWATQHRGLIAIHAAKGLGPVHGQRGLKEQCGVEPFCSVLNEAIKLHQETYWRGGGFLKKMSEHPFMPLGAIVAVANIVECKSTNFFGLQSGWVQDLSRNERAFGDYSKNRYGWILGEVRALDSPIPCAGALSLWEVPADIERQIRAQIEAKGEVVNG